MDRPSWITWKFELVDLNWEKGKTAFSCSWIHSVVVQAGVLWHLFDHGSHMVEGSSSPTCELQSLTATRNKLSHLSNHEAATCDWRGMHFLNWDKKLWVQPWTDLAETSKNFSGCSGGVGFESGACYPPTLCNSWLQDLFPFFTKPLPLKVAYK